MLIHLFVFLTFLWYSGTREKWNFVCACVSIFHICMCVKSSVSKQYRYHFLYCMIMVPQGQNIKYNFTFWILTFELKKYPQKIVITGILKLLSLTGITNTMWRLQLIPMWHSKCPALFCHCIHGHRWHHHLPPLPLHPCPPHHDGSSSSGWGRRERQATRGREQWRRSWRGPGESVKREDEKKYFFRINLLSTSWFSAGHQFF